jgi:hypothetical protein
MIMIITVIIINIISIIPPAPPSLDAVDKLHLYEAPSHHRAIHIFICNCIRCPPRRRHQSTKLCFTPSRPCQHQRNASSLDPYSYSYSESYYYS